MGDGFASALGLSPGQRLLQLQNAGLATRIADERRRWRRAWDFFSARMENRLIERVLLARISRAFDHLDDEVRLREILQDLRRDYGTGAASTLHMAPTPAPQLEIVEGAPTTAAWLRESADHRGLLIYTAGGGFMLPPAAQQVTCAERLGELCGLDALMNYHAMAPEAPFPAAIEDTVALCRWAFKRYGADQVVMASDTAGASVTLGALLMLRDAGDSLPAAVQLFSPWNDLSLSGWSYITKSATADSPFRMETAAFCARAYLAEAMPTNPLASAIFAELSDLPPLAVHTSRYDMHFDDALKLVQGIHRDGGHAEIRYWESPRHHLERFDTAEANNSLSMAAGFLRRYMDVRGVR